MIEIPDNPVGMRFGQFSIVSVDTSERGRRVWCCLCDPDFGGCGKKIMLRPVDVLSENRRTCGCVENQKKIRNATARREHPQEVDSWRAMVRRCYNTDVKSYKNYGARGITVCDRWRESFADFISDMGPKPSPKHSIDRLNVNGNYEPENCWWATQSEQCRNKRNNKIVECFGVSMCIAEWSETTGIGYQVLWSRLESGMSPEDAFTAKVDKTRSYMRYTHDGKTLTIMEWARELGMTSDLIRHRIVKGWSVSDALTKPVNQKMSHPIDNPKRRY